MVDRLTGEKFFHPLIQTILLFVGESCVGLIYLYHLKREEKNKLESEQAEPLLLKPENI